MFTVTVVHALSPEVIELLRGLIQGREAAPSVPAVTQQPPATEKPVETKPKPKTAAKADMKDFPVENQHSVSDFEKQAEPETPKAEAPATDGKAYTLEAVRAAAVAKTQEGATQREAVKALIGSLGARAISALDKSKYSEFMTKLAEI